MTINTRITTAGPLNARPTLTLTRTDTHRHIHAHICTHTQACTTQNITNVYTRAHLHNSLSAANIAITNTHTHAHTHTHTHARARAHTFTRTHGGNVVHNNNTVIVFFPYNQNGKDCIHPPFWYATVSVFTTFSSSTSFGPTAMKCISFVSSSPSSLPPLLSLSLLMLTNPFFLFCNVSRSNFRLVCLSISLNLALYCILLFCPLSSSFLDNLQ